MSHWTTPIAGMTDEAEPHTGPTLPHDFPAPLLRRICDAILAPLLSPCAPIKPYTRPWSRSTPTPWSNIESQSTTSRLTRFYTSPSNWADWKAVSIGSILGSCKNDLLAFCYCNKRIWSICGDMAYQHIRVANLAVGDILVSKRNLLLHTKVLEVYITDETETSQAQSDLNLSRFFIQAGILFLWAPRLHTIVLDLHAVPADQHIWMSFLSRLRQRLFISPIPGKSSTPRFLPTPKMNIVSGAGNEKPTSLDLTARWGDSQGLFVSPGEVSIPHLAIGMGYGAAGGIERGFGGMLDMLFSGPFSVPAAATNRVNASSAVIGGQMVKSPAPAKLDAITALDLLIPRPSWGHEESEGFELGLILKRLAGLQRLGLHADGMLKSSRRQVGFGLNRRPLLGAISQSVNSDEDEVDILVKGMGTVIYPTTTTNRNSQGRSGRSMARSDELSTSEWNSPQQSATYGVETWWVGVLNGLTSSTENPADPKETVSTASQSIEELRVAVSEHGGSDFGAFFALLLPYFHKMANLRVLIFDMEFQIPAEMKYLTRSQGMHSAIKGLLDRQRNYVEKLVKPYTPPTPGNSMHVQSPHGILDRDTVLVTGEGQTVDHRESTSGRASASTAVSRELIPPSLLQHVFFGDYHGLPNLPPPDTALDNSARPDPSQAVNPWDLMTGDSSNARIGSRNKLSDASSVGRLDMLGRRERTYAEINVDKRNVVPGMWWTIKQTGSDPTISSSTSEPIIIQGWEEVAS